MISDITGVILAGGANTRFCGKTKSTMKIGGKSVIAWMTDTLKDIFEEIIIVTNSKNEFSDFTEFKITGDIIPKKGPLSGIHAGLYASEGKSAFVFAGDMPFLNTGLIKRQIALFYSIKSAILVPSVNENIEPLHSVYHHSVQKPLEEYLSSKTNYAVRDFFGQVNVNFIRFEDSEETRMAFMNINQPSDIAAAEKILKANDRNLI